MKWNAEKNSVQIAISNAPTDRVSLATMYAMVNQIAFSPRTIRMKRIAPMMDVHQTFSDAQALHFALRNVFRPAGDVTV